MGDIVYYNLELKNSMAGSAQNGTADVTAQNTLNILENASLYLGSIIRLKADLFTCPISWFEVLQPVTDINKGIYTFTLVYGTQSVTKNVIWIPQDNSITPPPLGTLTQTGSPYYFIRSYQYFINLWNIALSDAYDELTGVVGNTPPFFNYNTTTNLIEFYINSANVEPNNPSLHVFCNTPITPFIKGFELIKSQSNEIDDLAYLIVALPSPSVTTPLNLVTIMSGVTPIVFIKVQQEYVCLNFWATVQTVTVLTNMNVVQEGYYTGTGTNQLAQNLTLQTALTDFLPDLTVSPAASNTVFIYNAPSLFRLFQFSNTTSPLRNINARIVFTTKQGFEFPLEIAGNQSCSLKFQFIKKGLAKNLIKANNKLNLE